MRIFLLMVDFWPGTSCMCEYSILHQPFPLGVVGVWGKRGATQESAIQIPQRLIETLFSPGTTVTRASAADLAVSENAERNRSQE